MIVTVSYVKNMFGTNNNVSWWEEDEDEDKDEDEKDEEEEEALLNS